MKDIQLNVQGHPYFLNLETRKGLPKGDILISFLYRWRTADLAGYLFSIKHSKLTVSIYNRKLQVIERTIN